MNRPRPPSAAHRHPGTSWLLAAVLLLAPVAAELGHTCLEVVPGGPEGRPHGVAGAATATETPPRSCPGCLHRVQGMGSMPAPLLLPEPGGGDCRAPAPPARAVLAPPPGRATARAPPLAVGLL